MPKCCLEDRPSAHTCRPEHARPDDLAPNVGPAATARSRSAAWTSEIWSKQYGTPLYVVDEEDFRSRCRDYRSAFAGGEVHYAGKAFLCREVARWIDAGGPRPRRLHAAASWPWR